MKMREIIIVLMAAQILFGLACAKATSTELLKTSAMVSLTATPNFVNKTKIPNDLIEKLIAEINDNKNNFRLTDNDLEKLYKHLKNELHDLNNDGVSEFFLHIEHGDWCGAGSNCGYWVFQKTESSYKLLLEDTRIVVKDTITNGYRDLSSEHKIGACKGGFLYWITPYKFDGKKYQEQKHEEECRAVKTQKIENN